MSEKLFPTAFPVKLDNPTLRIVKELKRKTGLSRSDILRRAVRFSVPKFLSGEASIAEAGGEKGQK